MFLIVSSNNFTHLIFTKYSNVAEFNKNLIQDIFVFLIVLKKNDNYRYLYCVFHFVFVGLSLSNKQISSILPYTVLPGY